jgi:hypothetical protein
MNEILYIVSAIARGLPAINSHLFAFSKHKLEKSRSVGVLARPK